MRIDRLDLIRYGAFQDRSLAFAADAPVTIVYGPNEAGKSTALAALEDLLFGFPLRSAAAFRFKTSELRLGGVVSGADGARLEPEICGGGGRDHGNRIGRHGQDRLDRQDHQQRRHHPGVQ